MESQILRASKSLFALFLAVVVALSLVPLPRQQAFADEGALAAALSADGAGAASSVNTTSNLAAVQKTLSGANVQARGKVQGKGWGAWTKASETVGKASGKGLKSLKVRLIGMQGLSGSITYQTYKRGSGWLKAASNGAATKTARNVEAVRMSLTGEIAQHYDVLYRSYISGKGWQPWVKNNAKSGLTGKGRRVNAVQVKLSPRTEEAAGKTTETVGIRYESRFKTTGWQAWTGDGGTSGKASGKKVLNGFAVQLDAGALSGGVRYRACYQGSKWTGWKSAGYAGKTSKRFEAMQVQLTGAIAERYDVYYRAYSQNAGWLDWAKNGEVAGSTGFNLRLQAFQMKLVAKGGAAPGDTLYPTVNLMEATKSLNGIDIASHQAGIDLSKVKADFVIVKATQGNWYTNTEYSAQVQGTLDSGKLLGIYHFADLKGSANKQADYFVKAVKPYIGKAVLFLDYEADILEKKNTVNWAKKFMDRVYKKTGVKPLIYMSKSVTSRFDWSKVAKNYGLWVAQYANYKKVKGYQAYPWTDGNGYGAWDAPQLFQYTSQGCLSGYGAALDFDKFYGSILSWRKLAQKS